MPGAVRPMPFAARARLWANHNRGLIISLTDRDSSVHRFQFEISHQHFGHCASRKNVSYPLILLLSKGYGKVGPCRILPHIYSVTPPIAFLSSQISALGFFLNGSYGRERTAGDCLDCLTQKGNRLAPLLRNPTEPDLITITVKANNVSESFKYLRCFGSRRSGRSELYSPISLGRKTKPDFPE